jgi:hypothetical protein
MSDNDNKPPPEEIVISLDDLSDDPLPTPSASPSTQSWVSGQDVLVIDSMDLTEPVSQPGHAPSAAIGDLPAVSQQAYAMAGQSKKGMLSGGLVGSLLIQMFVAGALGGLLAWGVTEPTLAMDMGHASGIGEVFLQAMIFFVIVGGVIGLFLGAVEGLSALNLRKALTGGAIGLLIGAVGGAIAGLLGQAAYGALGGTGDRFTISQLVARAIGWAIAGLFIGVGHGAAGRSPKKIINGLCGGALGGFVGGILFDPIGMVMSLTGSPGLMSRLLALVVIGAASGAAIGLIEELRKEAWLQVVAGPLSGKQFILYRKSTVIGSLAGSDIALLKDTSVAPQHCVLEATGANYAVRDLGSVTGTFVNRTIVQRQALRRGDVIQVGQTALEYQDRVVSPQAAPSGV